MHSFTPVATETSGVIIGPRSLEFLKKLGRRMKQQTGEDNATSFLLQIMSVAIQQGNAVSILGGFRG